MKTTLHPPTLYKCTCYLKLILPSHVTFTINCFILHIFFFFVFRQTRKTTESSETVTPTSRNIYYMINKTEDSTVSNQNEYGQLRISSLRVYNDLSLKLKPAPTSYINLSSLKWSKSSIQIYLCKSYTCTNL